MNAQDIRAAALQTPLKTEPVATPFWSLPDGTSTDGHVALRDVPADEMIALESTCKDADGKVNASAFMAALLIKSLVAKDSGEPLFQITDRDVVAHMGTSVLMPISQECQKFLGVTPDAVDAAKKNLGQTTVEGSISSLPQGSNAP